MSKFVSRLSFGLAFIFSIYLLGRAFFHFTDGFTIGNISSNFSYNSSLETENLATSEKSELDLALSQSYHYLAKGCQSYVFESSDGKYVIKFFKYQRFRTPPWLFLLPNIEPFKSFVDQKIFKRQEKLNTFLNSWKVANDFLKKESALVYVHLNKTNFLHKNLQLFDKLGLKHSLDLDQFEFCVQKKATILEDYIVNLRDQKLHSQANLLIDKLLSLILSEYARGLADFDHALMQNTGVINEEPVHIDVGRFQVYDGVLQEDIMKQELFSKTFRLHKWLQSNYPELGGYLDQRLADIIGERYFTLEPIWH